MDDKTNLYFGWGIVVLGVCMVAWQLHLRRAGRVGQDWLNSQVRNWRRVMIGVVFVLLGGLMLVDTYELVALEGNPLRLIIYVFAVGGLALYLVLLALMDALETLRKARAEMVKIAATQPEPLPRKN